MKPFSEMRTLQRPHTDKQIASPAAGAGVLRKIRNLSGRRLLPHVEDVAIRQDVQMASSPRSVLHPILEVCLRANALCPVVLKLASLVVFAELAGATRENLEAQPAMRILAGHVHEPWIIHMRMRCRHAVVG